MTSPVSSNAAPAQVQNNHETAPTISSWNGRTITTWLQEQATAISLLVQKILNYISTIGSAMAATLRAICSFGPIQVKQLSTAADQAAFQNRIAALEKKATYPLGPNESFQIDHGADYFAFFRRLGELHYFVAEENKEVVGVAAGILRQIPLLPGQAPQKTWYLCDLKVDPDHRGKHIPIYIFMKAAWNALKCTRGYAISMNPAHGENRIVKLFKNHSWIPVAPPVQLAIFSMNCEQMKQNRALLEQHRGPVSYLSLQGKKDLVLDSTKQPMPLLHAQFGPCKADIPTHDEPQEGFTHMFCMPTTDILYAELEKQDIHPQATASILSSGMEKTDWNFILTSDI